MKLRDYIGTDVKELGYEEAIELSMKELKEQGIECSSVYEEKLSMGKVEYLLPLNEELFNEFCYNGDFDEEEYLLFIIKRIEIENTEKACERYNDK